jgi:hypothetical protein
LLLLESLREAGPHGVSEVTLRAQLDLHGYSLTLPQLRSELRQLADKSCIGNLSHPLDDSLVHWTLTGRGRLILVDFAAGHGAATVHPKVVRKRNRKEAS